MLMFKEASYITPPLLARMVYVVTLDKLVGEPLIIPKTGSKYKPAGKDAGLISV